MGGHERICKLVPSLGTNGYGFHDQLHRLWELGFLLETESFLVWWFVVVIMMFGTKLVHVCEGAVRYPVEWS